MLVWTNKSGYGKHCGRKDIAADNVSVHHVQEVVDVIESKIKPCILFTRSQSQQGRLRRLRILCSRMTQSCNYKDSSYNGFWQRDLERSVFHASHTVGVYMQCSIPMSDNNCVHKYGNYYYYVPISVLVSLCKLLVLSSFSNCSIDSLQA